MSEIAWLHHSITSFDFGVARYPERITAETAWTESAESALANTVLRVTSIIKTA